MVNDVNSGKREMYGAALKSLDETVVTLTQKIDSLKQRLLPIENTESNTPNKLTAEIQVIEEKLKKVENLRECYLAKIPAEESSAKRQKIGTASYCAVQEADVKEVKSLRRKTHAGENLPPDMPIQFDTNDLVGGFCDLIVRLEHEKYTNEEDRKIFRKVFKLPYDCQYKGFSAMQFCARYAQTPLLVYDFFRDSGCSL